MEFHCARTARMAGAAASAIAKHRQAGATNQAGRASATGGGLGLAALASKALAVAQATACGLLVAFSATRIGRLKAMKPHENLPDRL